MKQKVSTNFIYNLMYQLSNIIVPFFTLPYLSRILGTEGLGRYSYAYSVAYFFWILIKLGLNNYGNRLIASKLGDKQKISRVFWSIYLWQITVGIVAVASYGAYAILCAPDKTIACIMIIYVASGLLDVDWCLYGMEAFRYTAIRDITVKIFIALSIFIFVNSRNDVWKYALIFSLGLLINQIINIPMLSKKLSITRVSLEDIKQHIVPSIVLFIPVIAVSIFKFIDKIMIGNISGDAEVGYYHAAENIVRVPMALINALGIVMLPRISRLIAEKNNAQEIKKNFDYSIYFSMFMSSLICMGIMTVAKEFVPLFYGEGFEQCVVLFYILLPSCIFTAFANVVRTQILIPKRKDKTYVMALLIGVIVNVSLNTLLIPKLGAVGAAYGTLFSEIIVCILQCIFLRNEVSFGTYVMHSIPFVCSGGVVFLALHGTSFSNNSFVNLVIKVLAAGSGYLIILLSIMGIGYLIGKLRV